MPLHPISQLYWYSRIKDVFVYLDDIDSISKGLAAYGPVEMKVIVRGGPDSRFDVVDDLIGRANIRKVEVGVTLPDHESAWVTIDRTYGVSVNVPVGELEIRGLAEHFLGSLDVRRRSRWQQLLGPPLDDVSLVLDYRRSATQKQSQRRHDLVLALISGGVGALIGAIATLLAAAVQAD